LKKTKKLKKKKTVDNFTVSLTVEDLKRLEMNYYCSCFVFHHKMKSVFYEKAVTCINPSMTIDETEVVINDSYEHEYPIEKFEIDLSKQDLEQLIVDAKHYLALDEWVFYMGSS